MDGSVHNEPHCALRFVQKLVLLVNFLCAPSLNTGWAYRLIIRNTCSRILRGASVCSNAAPSSIGLRRRPITFAPLSVSMAAGSSSSIQRMKMYRSASDASFQAVDRC